MVLKEYKPGTAFPGVIGRTIDESNPAWPEPLRAKEGAPNVLFIVLDDTGFGHLGCDGSPIKTPNLDKLANNGLLSQWDPHVIESDLPPALEQDLQETLEKETVTH